jgi:hypothetical protein
MINIYTYYEKGGNVGQKDDIDALERFVLDNPELENLEDLLSQFNIFETLNIVDTELRHSYVLAWLLNPNANHGLGGYFSKKFIKYLISNNKQSLDPSISLIDFEIFDLSSLEVRREWQHIDILMILEEEKYVIAIENKIGGSEHGDQLQRYKKIIDTEFKDYKKIFVYLTPNETTPTDEENWVTFNYQIIGNLLSDIIKYKKDSINEQVLNFISHYKTILRRQIVGESEVERLCKQIYKKHQSALDLIFQHKPDLQKEISDYLVSLIKESDETIIDSSSKTYIRFTTPALDKLIPKISEGWTASKRLLLFEFDNSRGRLFLKLLIGPGNQNLRTKLLEFFRQEKSFFKRAYLELRPKWHTVYTKEFTRKRDYEETDILDIKEKINNKFQHFLKNDLVKINKFFEDKWEE